MVVEGEVGGSEVSVVLTVARPGKPSSVDPFGALAKPFSQRLSGRDVAMGWILAVMIAFGAGVGFAFPYLVRPLIAVHPGEQSTFRSACVIAGFCVGGFAYGVARFTLYRANRRLARLAAYDSLTGLYNQRQFVSALGSELARAERTGQCVSLLITDLDHFKRINDEHGHLVGNDVLAAVAERIAGAVRPFDVPCRIGGEEFAIVLPGASKPEAKAVAQRIRGLVELRSDTGLPVVTVSCGIATYPEDAPSTRLLTSHADDAMYAAKAAGRNTVCAWEDIAGSC